MRQVLVFLLALIFPGVLWAQTSRFNKTQLPSVTVFTDAAQTFTLEQTFNTTTTHNQEIKFSTTGSPSVNGGFWFDGTNFLFREGGTNKTFASSSNATQLQGRNISSTAPTNSQVLAWNTATSVWEPQAPSGGSTFDGNVDGTTQGYLSGNTASSPIKLRDTNGTSFQDGDGKEGALRRILSVTTTTASQTEMLINGTDRLTAALNTAHAYRIRVLARGTTGTNTGKVAHYDILVSTSRGAGDVALVGTQLLTVVAEDVAAWDCTTIANTTVQALQVMVTADGNGNVDWRGYVDEVALP